MACASTMHHEFPDAIRETFKLDSAPFLRASQICRWIFHGPHGLTFVEFLIFYEGPQLRSRRVVLFNETQPYIAKHKPQNKYPQSHKVASERN